MFCFSICEWLWTSRSKIKKKRFLKLYVILSVVSIQVTFQKYEFIIFIA